MYMKALFAGWMVASTILRPVPATAQAMAGGVEFALEPQALDRALTEVARLTGREIIIASGAATGKTAPRLAGHLSADEAIRRLLAGSGLVADFRADVVLIRAAPANALISSDNDIVVTGSRLRGTVSASPVRVLTARQIRNAGQADLGEAARAIPQSFNGGQNPGIGIGVTGANANQNAASSLNLRGLGADATLTLLNGHRLAHDGTGQAVDISAIPLAAVDRLEIVPDGASALYGSDAVGGVANVILKRDFRGLDTSARIDIPTDGGGTRQRYTATSGDTWRGGGGLLAVDIDHSEPITAGDRGITRGLSPSTTLVREQSHQGGIATVHQQLAPSIGLEADAIYSSRSARGETPYSSTGTVRDSGNTNSSETRSFALAPRLVVDASRDWQLTLQGLYGDDRLKYDTVGYFGGAEIARFAGCICNRIASIEGGAEGALFALPGGPARLALGGGVRRATFHYTQAGSLDFSRDRTTSFAYGELALPLVSTSNALPGAQRLMISAAGRYERYRGTAGVLSPKLGIVYSPLAGVELKGSWGRSFKAPTLYQQYLPGLLTVLNAEDLGYTSYPTGTTIGIVNGGSTSLQPERARTWSATLGLRPDRWPGAHMEISYFDVDFTNRVQVPVQSLFNALGNPSYDAFISYAPSVAQVASALSLASGGLDNQTGRSFDPTQLAAIIDQGYRNVTREHAAGVDVAADYHAGFSRGRTLDVSLDASYLTSRRILIPALPAITLAGTVFNPPRWRGRAGGSLTTPSLTLAAYANYIGGVEDRRRPAIVGVRGQTTVDLAVRLTLAKTGWLRDTELALTLQNAFDVLPAPIATSFAYATPFDSTNYSAVGRVVGLQVSRRW